VPIVVATRIDQPPTRYLESLAVVVIVGIVCALAAMQYVDGIVVSAQQLVFTRERAASSYSLSWADTVPQRDLGAGHIRRWDDDNHFMPI
jgi:hypothetical protein